MAKIRIGVLGPADIAMRKMIPAILKCDNLEYAGVAVAYSGERSELSESDVDDSISEASLLKAERFVENFGGIVFRGYRNMLMSDAIDAVYIALPPALHHRWAKLALECGKHVLLEKPFTTKAEHTEELVSMAESKGLVISENFAFIYHAQIEKIREIVSSGELGEVRLIRSNFGFPFRGESDFRYQKALGGGALYDCGCYTIRMMNLLGEDLQISDCRLFSKDGFDVDIYGEISAVAGNRIPIQLSFGMDQQYNCELEIWGSKGFLRSPRIYTAPADQNIELILAVGSDRSTIEIPADDQFRNSASFFAEMIRVESKKARMYTDIRGQSELVEQCMRMALMNKMKAKDNEIC